MQTHSSRPTSENSKNILSANPNKAMQEMMNTIDRMHTVYERETAALEALDTKGFLSLQEEKLHTTKAYRTGIEEVLRRKKEMKTVDPALKTELTRMQRNFSDLSVKNMEALKQMQRTMERLANTVQRAARESVNKSRAFSYGESGKLESNERKSVSIGVSETA
jgi:hypothetical protein